MWLPFVFSAIILKAVLDRSKRFFFNTKMKKEQSERYALLTVVAMLCATITMHNKLSMQWRLLNSLI